MKLTPKPYRHRRASRLSYDERIAPMQRAAAQPFAYPFTASKSAARRGDAADAPRRSDDDYADGELFALMHDDSPSDNSAELRAMRSAALAALDRLTDRQRAAVELHLLGGMTQREIAALWGVTPSAVCHLLDRACTRMRNLIVLK